VCSFVAYSYDGWDWSVDEKSIVANIDFIATNLLHYGYKIVTVDYYWYLDLNGRTMYMDEFGRPQPDPNRFPSSMGGQGFKKLAAYAHSKGLYFGIHTMRGVNQVAIDQKLRVQGLNVTVDQVYDSNNKCPWGVNQPLGNFYSLDLSKKGGQEFHDSLYHQYAEWGVDFIKNVSQQSLYHFTYSLLAWLVVD
jgi:alpha-galactosidase